MENVIHFILMPIVWIPIVAILAFLTYRNYKKLNKLKVLNVDSVLLMLEIPRENDKKELAAEQLFASLHGILRDKQELKNSGGVQDKKFARAKELRDRVRRPFLLYFCKLR